MKVDMYAIKDVVSGAFAPPFLGKNDAVAIRSFRKTLGQNPFPDDYELYLIGGYDDETGLVDTNGYANLPVLISSKAIILASEENADE